MDSLHQSVLTDEVMEALAVGERDTVVDATVGGAGHFAALLSKLGPEGTLIGIDADENAHVRARHEVARAPRIHLPRVHLIHDNFRNLGKILNELNVATIDKALFDLGWSGHQLAARRGFSFQHDEPLLMTYGPGEQSAATLVNSATEEELADMIYAYGEERFARGIAKAIVALRGSQKILSTGQLVEAVLAGTPTWYHHRKIHPATKTFQALRMAVNDELPALTEALRAALSRLAPSGRIAIIAFHSIEDRLVKSTFRAAQYEGLGFGSKKPITPSAKELAENRRARSAKLRVFTRAPLSLRVMAPHYV